jgi:hypothetical protein
MSRVTGGLSLSAFLLAVLLGPPAAKADTFVFNDLSDTITVSGPLPVVCSPPSASLASSASVPRKVQSP